MNTIEKYNALKAKLEDFAEKGNQLSQMMYEIENIENEVTLLNNEIQENEQDVLPDGIEDVNSWCDDLYDLKSDALSWLPSSMIC